MVLLTDSYSKFPIIHLLPAIASKHVISALCSVSVFSIPEEIISNTGSQFIVKNTRSL